MPTKMLPGLRWRRAWIAHLGCVQGCLDYLGLPVSRPWLYGGTGHAFVVNVHETLCPSGPTAWNTRMLFDLAPNLGYRTAGVHAWKQQAGAAFPAKQREAWDFVRAALDRGLPCYGWQLEVPDYYVICGYDDVGYYYSGWGCDAGKGPLSWQRLGDWDVTAVDVHSVEPTEPAPDVEVVRGALAAALRHAEGPEDLISPGYRSGPAGFELWADALAAGRAQRDGSAYNAAAWGECRALAVEFLGEVRARLPGRCDGALDDAAGHYAAVRDRLARLQALNPMREDADWQSPLQCSEDAGLLREAAVSERLAIGCLAAVASAL